MTFTSKKRGVGVIAGAILLAGLLPLSASAASISFDSELAFFGDFDITGGATLATATGMGFSNPTDITGGTGDFAFADGGTATFSAFDFDPPALGTIITFANGGAFTATSVTATYGDDASLNLSFAGLWSLDGFDDTAGSLTLTANSLGGLNVFSGTGSIVPVPGALLLFGSALIGLGAARRKA